MLYSFVHAFFSVLCIIMYVMKIFDNKILQFPLNRLDKRLTDLNFTGAQFCGWYHSSTGVYRFPFTLRI